MAGQSSGKTPEVGKGFWAEVVDVIELAVVVCDAETLDLERELLSEEMKVVDVEAALKLLNEVGEACVELTRRSAFQESLYRRILGIKI